MKLAVTALFLCAVATLSGCPIYDHDDDDGCYRSSDCAPGYRCDRYSGDCNSTSEGEPCTRPDQCAVDETCSADAECVPGDCTFSGCVRGYRCDSRSGIWSCVSTSNNSGTGEGGAAGAGQPGPESAEGGAAGAGVGGEAGSN